MEQKNIITKEGLKELQVELRNLVENERPKVIQDIKEAREQGDLSENAEFDAAREKQGQIEDRISEIEAVILNSEVVQKSKKVKEGSKSPIVRVGSEVTIQDLSTKTKEKYTIVGSLEADPFASKISNLSPVAVAILNLSVGDTATVIAKKKYDVKVMNIKN